MAKNWPGAKRTVTLHSHGPDVTAWGRALVPALAAHGHKAVNSRNGTFGRGLLVDAVAFQHLGGLTPYKGVIGELTQRALWPYVDLYGLALLKLPIPKPNPVEVHRNGVLHWWEWLALKSPVPYDQYRPGPHGPNANEELLEHGGDCSDGFEQAYEDAGAPNPNGGPFNGEGYTGSLILKGLRVALSQVLGGEGTFYGCSASDTEHIQCELGPKNWRGPGWTIGHGSTVIVPRPRTYRGDYIETRAYPLGTP